MTQQVVRISEKPTMPYKGAVYNEFILWSAMPETERVRLGIENQGQFCEYYNIGINTPTVWKNRPDFQDRVNKILRMWAFDRKPNIVQGIYRAAIKGNPMSQMLWLQYFEGFNPKQEVIEVKKVEIGENDIRRIIDLLPDESQRQKFYGYIREIGEAATIAARASEGDADDRWDERPSLILSGEADHDAQDAPNDQADALPKRYPHGLRANMVGAVHPHHYQSPPWWGEI